MFLNFKIPVVFIDKEQKFRGLYQIGLPNKLPNNLQECQIYGLFFFQLLLSHIFFWLYEYFYWWLLNYITFHGRMKKKNKSLGREWMDKRPSRINLGIFFSTKYCIHSSFSISILFLSSNCNKSIWSSEPWWVSNGGRDGKRRIGDSRARGTTRAARDLGS